MSEEEKTQNGVFDIAEEVRKLPTVPGVYIMKEGDTVLYVGKAINLKNRVRQYFQSPRGKSPKIRKMISRIEYFEYIVCDSELEALVLSVMKQELQAVINLGALIGAVIGILNIFL